MTQPHMAFGFGAGGAGEAGLLRGRWAAPRRWEGPLLQAGCTHQEGLPWAHDPESVACQSAWASRSLSVGLRLRSRCSRGLVPTGPRGPPSLCGLHAIPRKGRAKGVCRAGPPEGERQERVLAGGICCTVKPGQIRGVISSGSRAPLGAMEPRPGSQSSEPQCSCLCMGPRQLLLRVLGKSQEYQEATGPRAPDPPPPVRPTPGSWGCRGGWESKCLSALSLLS